MSQEVRCSGQAHSAGVANDQGFAAGLILTVYQLLSNGINRPGEMVRSVEGLSTKVLNECLRRNMQFGILEKINYPEIPPRVEYMVTAFGEQFIEIVGKIEAQQDIIDQRQ